MRALLIDQDKKESTIEINTFPADNPLLMAVVGCFKVVNDELLPIYIRRAERVATEYLCHYIFRKYSKDFR